MAFTIGSFAIDEIIYGVAQNFNDEILYTADQLSSASIEISADPTQVTDKNGNIIRNVYKQKEGTFNATSALLHPALINAGSGSEMMVASAMSAIENVPKMVTVLPGGTVNIADMKAGTMHIQGLFGNGANDTPLTAAEVQALVDAAADDKITLPAKTADGPIKYMVRYERDITEGIALKNTADEFPKTQRLTLLCSYIDPCDDGLKACYVYIPSFQPDPSTTISLDSENVEMDFNGNIQIDYCGTDRVLYYIY